GPFQDDVGGQRAGARKVIKLHGNAQHERMKGNACYTIGRLPPSAGARAPWVRLLMHFIASRWSSIMADSPLRIVFLDRDSLPADAVFQGPSVPHELILHSRSTPDQVAERIRDADIVITNKVEVRAA